MGPKAANYGPYHDTDNSCAGSDDDLYVIKGDHFPPSKIIIIIRKNNALLNKAAIIAALLNSDQNQSVGQDVRGRRGK